LRRIAFDSIPYVPAGHEDPLNPGVLKKVLLPKAALQAGRIQMINWALLPAGNRFAPHYHEDMQEVFVVVSGEVEITVDEETFALGRGDAVVIDAREVHQMVNRGADDAEYLAIGITREEGGRTVVVEPA
jgi:mannose-6-phosphate isomerase-like protein (cupin superfamily)